MENNMIAVVNPITRVATILHKVNETLNEIEIYFEQLDEWNRFTTDALYDVHFLYDEVFNMYITKVNTDESEGAIWVNCDVNFLLDRVVTDADYRESIYMHTQLFNLNK
jgi:hypothetical protein